MMYEAETLEDIARHFEMMAGRAVTDADDTVGLQKKLLNREAIIWSQAASMLRQTTMKPQGLPSQKAEPDPTGSFIALDAALAAAKEPL